MSEEQTRAEERRRQPFAKDVEIAKVNGDPDEVQAASCRRRRALQRKDLDMSAAKGILEDGTTDDVRRLQESTFILEKRRRRARIAAMEMDGDSDDEDKEGEF